MHYWPENRQIALNWYWYERGLQDGYTGKVLGETSRGYWYNEGFSQGTSSRQLEGKSYNCKWVKEAEVPKDKISALELIISDKTLGK